jgi:hypothetical protein
MDAAGYPTQIKPGRFAENSFDRNPCLRESHAIKQREPIYIANCQDVWLACCRYQSEVGRHDGTVVQLETGRFVQVSGAGRSTLSSGSMFNNHFGITVLPPRIPTLSARAAVWKPSNGLSTRWREVNAAALAIRSGATIKELSEITFVHPRATETMQVCSTKLGSIVAG